MFQLVVVFSIFYYKPRLIVRGRRKKFGLIKANEVFGFEGVLSYGKNLEMIMISIFNVFLEMGLNGSTCFPNIGFSTQVRNLVNS